MVGSIGGHGADLGVAAGAQLGGVAVVKGPSAWSLPQGVVVAGPRVAGQGDG